MLNRRVESLLLNTHLNSKLKDSVGPMLLLRTDTFLYEKIISEIDRQSFEIIVPLRNKILVMVNRQ